MTTDTDNTSSPTPTEASEGKRGRFGRNTRLAGLAAAMIMGLNWCHPPTPDINIFHRDHSGGQQAIADTDSAITAR